MLNIRLLRGRRVMDYADLQVCLRWKSKLLVLNQKMKLEIFEGLSEESSSWMQHQSSKVKGRDQNVLFGGNSPNPRYK
jgi:hypothetical protein